MENIITSLFALLIGFSLGLLGGGGSILTVPVLVYWVGITAPVATAYSLFVVGFSSLIGAWQHFKKAQVDSKVALLFSFPSFLTVYGVRKYVLPIIPSHILQMGDFVLTKNSLLMLFFALLMFLAAYSMINKKKTTPNTISTPFDYPKIILQSIGIGFLSGIVGAGGGFMIVPALVMLMGLDMKKAIGTSLLIIAINSLIGFMGDVGKTPIEWAFLLQFSGVAILGIGIGEYMSNFINADNLKKAFGYFIVCMSILILGKEIFSTI